MRLHNKFKMQVTGTEAQLSNGAVNKNIRIIWVVYAHIYVNGKSSQQVTSARHQRMRAAEVKDTLYFRQRCEMK